MSHISTLLAKCTTFEQNIWPHTVFFHILFKALFNFAGSYLKSSFDDQYHVNCTNDGHNVLCDSKQNNSLRLSSPALWYS